MKGMLSFFKPSAFVKSFFVFGVAFFATLSISCKQLASFDPVVDGNQTVVGGGTTSVETTEFAFNLKATHGLVRKISLEWTAFSGAKYYEIYFAESSAAEFVKIGETQQPFFDDAVGAGRTGYFKVCAVKANGASTPFSSTVVGTSLAVPMISDGEVGEFEATISWSMENARGIDGTDYYEKSLKFEVVCQPKGGSGGENKVLSASGFSGSSYSYKFENLSSSQEYEFYVEAYLEGDTQSREKSPTVDKTTLTAYTPIAPKFSASEGDNAKGISLLITLPDMVTVRTFVKDSENPKEKQEVPYPLCFEIYRKHEKAETYSQDSKRTLYYNGTELTKNIVEYQEAGAPYEAGKQVAWFDDDASLIGGEKYDYMIRSVPDINYSKTVCPDDKQYANEDGKITPVDKATTAQGWKSAPPSFNVKFGEDGGRTLSAGNTEVLSISFGFSAEWKDLGKAGDYKFAIKQNRTPWSGGSGTNAWLKNGETIFFETLDGINSCVQTFGSASGGLKPEEEGSYSYTLYIVSKNDEGTDDINSESNILDSMTARDKVVATKEVNLPKAELKAEGGYKDKVVLEIPTCEPNVTYKLERAELVDKKPTNEQVIDLNVPGSGVFKYEDKVDGNRKYSYVLKAIATSGVFALSTSQVAETLGTPDVSFRKEEEYFGYDSVTISFDGVLAAKNYVVKLGEGGGFGGGKIFQFASGFSGSTGNAEVSLNGNTYTVTVKGPEGYDNARLAGTKANVIVTAHSGVGEAPSSPVPVNVLGPAPLVATVNTFDEAKEESITVSWNKVEGAKGYLIRRVMYSDVAMKNVANGSGVTYYYEVASGMIKADGDSEAIGKRATIAASDASFKLTDKYMEITTNDDTLKEYQEKQAKIAWGLPFRYVVLPVLESGDFGFNDLELDGNGKVAYANFAEKQTDGTATYGYGLKVKATKSESATEQNVSWEKPFYGEKLTPKVYRRKFASRDKNEWEAVAATVNNNAINYFPSGEDRYYAWEYVVKYRNDTSDKIALSYVNWLKNSDHDETRYDYGSADKEKLNKGYLLAMEYKAYYGGGEHPSKTDKNYYSEDVNITSWYYNDRTLGPDKVELKVLSLDLASGWQTVGTLDSEIKSFTASALTDIIVEPYLNDKVIKLKPEGISEGKKDTTNGPLKILRSAKHYYGLNLSRGGNEPQFDCKNYEEYAYRQITDEELVKSTMLILGEALDGTDVYREAETGTAFEGNGSRVTLIRGITGTVDWRKKHATSGRGNFWLYIDNYVHKWRNSPYSEKEIPCSFLSIEDVNTENTIRGSHYGNNADNKKLRALAYNSTTVSSSNLIPIKISSYDSDITLDTYSGTVNFSQSDSEFHVTVTREGNICSSFDITSKNDVPYWSPIRIGDVATFYGQNFDYGWWPDNNGNYKDKE